MKKKVIRIKKLPQPSKGNRNKCVDEAVDAIKRDLVPRIDLLDERDKEQYNAAKKIMIDLTTVITRRTEAVESTIDDLKEKERIALEERKRLNNELLESFKQLDTKVDSQLTKGAEDLKQISTRLDDIAVHGTALARHIDMQLNKIEVNGGTYPLNEALKHLYQQHQETHRKLNELNEVTAGIRAKAHLYAGLQEAFDKMMLFKIFKSKFGAIVAIFIGFIIINSILHAMGINVDIDSIIKWLFRTSQVAG